MSFPKDFVWGAASAAHQVEGAAFEDGKGLSIWDVFCKKPGAVHQGHTGNVACDHYHRTKSDIALMKDLGLRGYRLSISWPRIFPKGIGETNEAGLSFYDRLIDDLLAAGIEPFITLFHWDFPYDLYLKGGWLNRDSSDWFSDYATCIGARLSDRVTNWMTLNEPQSFIGIGHWEGKNAPGLQLPFSEMLLVGHNVLLAHGKSVQALRASAKSEIQVGYAPVGVVRYPASEDPKDIEAARKATFAVDQKFPWNNSWWMDPVFLGHYPEDGMKLYGEDAPQIEDGDMETICQPSDFFAANIYSGQPVKADADGKAVPVPHGPGDPVNSMEWPVTPECLYWCPRFFYERYKKPIYVTENGFSNLDFVALDGKVHDQQRIDFAQRYLQCLRRAILDGVDVRGYFHWTLMDNFEWASGYNKRFGLIHVDFTTLSRTPKDSYHWYNQVISTNGGIV